MCSPVPVHEAQHLQNIDAAISVDAVELLLGEHGHDFHSFKIRLLAASSLGFMGSIPEMRGTYPSVSMRNLAGCSFVLGASNCNILSSKVLMSPLNSTLLAEVLCPYLALATFNITSCSRFLNSNRILDASLATWSVWARLASCGSWPSSNRWSWANKMVAIFSLFVNPVSARDTLAHPRSARSVFPCHIGLTYSR